MQRIAIGCGALAAVSIVVALIAIRAVGDRSDRIDQLTNDLVVAHDERDQLAIEIERAESGAAIIESRWLAAVAAGGDLSLGDSRLLAVEAITRSPTAESVAALGGLLLADPRSDPPIVELEHGGPVWVTDAASAADLVASGSDDTTVKLWSVTGDLHATLPHAEEVRAVDFSADDRIVATATDDGAVVAWTTAGAELASIRHTDQVNDVVVADDGALMVSASHTGTALVADTETGEILYELAHPDIVWTAALSPGAERVATGAQDGPARVWDLGTGAEIASYDIGEPVTVVDFSPDGRWLFAGGRNGTAILVDRNDDEAGQPLDGAFRGGVIDIDWHPDGTELAVVSLGGANRYDLLTGTLVAEHQVAGGTRGVAYGPDGSWFVTGSGDFQFSFGEIAFWDTATGVKLVNLNLGGPVESVSVHPTGTVLAGFRTTDDLVEVGGAWLVPGPDHWVALACTGTDGTISEQTWSRLTGESATHDTACP